MQKHEGPSNLGRMVNGVFCVKKIEIANIHQAFKTFYVNRKSQVDSKNPENATILRKNLSFETQKSKDQISETDTSLKFSKSLLSLPCNDTSIDNIVLNGALSINFIAEEENDESLKKPKLSVFDSDAEESLFSNDLLNNTTKLSLKLTTLLVQKLPAKDSSQDSIRRSKYSNRSFTVINKNSSFTELTKNNEERCISRSSNKKNTSIESFSIKVLEKNTENGQTILSIRLPFIQEILVLHKNEVIDEFVEKLIQKYDLEEDSAKEFRKQFNLCL